MSNSDFRFDAERNRHVLIRYFPDTATPMPNPPIPVYIGPPLLGRMLRIELRDKVVCGVCTCIHRKNGVVWIRPGLPGTTRTPFVREEILCITVEDL